VEEGAQCGRQELTRLMTHGRAVRRVLSKYLIPPFQPPRSGHSRRVAGRARAGGTAAATNLRFVNWSPQKEVEGRYGEERERERERERHKVAERDRIVAKRRRRASAVFRSPFCFLPPPLVLFFPILFPCFSFPFCWKAPGVPPDNRVT